MNEITNVSWPGWEVVRKIGNGSFGSVYEIRRNVFGDVERAALKVITIPQSKSDIEELLSEGYDDASVTERFRGYLQDIVKEYSLMAKMKGHTNVVYCDDLQYTQHEDGIGWDIYIKMELLTPMLNVLDKEIDPEMVLQVGIDICNALVLCRHYNIIHRDIKPQNIFVSDRGDYKLGDFGIAKTAEKTTGGTKIGTYKYMAPEVYNNQPYGLSADIYSLGMVLYWLLNRRRTPFLPLPPQAPTASQEEEARRRRFMGEPLPPPAFGSPTLKAIVLKACAYNPKQRYATAEEMLEDLKKEAAGQPVTVASAETPQPKVYNAPQNPVNYGISHSNREPFVPEVDATIGAFGQSIPRKVQSPTEVEPPKPTPGPIPVTIPQPPVNYDPYSAENDTSDFDATIGAFGQSIPRKAQAPVKVEPPKPTPMPTPVATPVSIPTPGHIPIPKPRPIPIDTETKIPLGTNVHIPIDTNIRIPTSTDPYIPAGNGPYSSYNPVGGSPYNPSVGAYSNPASGASYNPTPAPAPGVSYNPSPAPQCSLPRYPESGTFPESKSFGAEDVGEATTGVFGKKIYGAQDDESTVGTWDTLPTGKNAGQQGTSSSPAAYPPGFANGGSERSGQRAPLPPSYQPAQPAQQDPLRRAPLPPTYQAPREPARHTSPLPEYQETQPSSGAPSQTPAPVRETAPHASEQGSSMAPETFGPMAENIGTEQAPRKKRVWLWILIIVVLLALIGLLNNLLP